MPGLDFYTTSEQVTRVDAVEPPTPEEDHINLPAIAEELPRPPKTNVYYNARLDPKNYLEGPISANPATRLRQMLARPGIVVSIRQLNRVLWAKFALTDCSWYL